MKKTHMNISKPAKLISWLCVRIFNLNFINRKHILGGRYFHTQQGIPYDNPAFKKVDEI